MIGKKNNWLEKYPEKEKKSNRLQQYKEGGTSGREVQTKQVVPLPPFIPYTEGQIWNMEHAQDVVRAAPQRKGKAAKALDIARNPMTALQSLSDRGSIPDNFDKGERNIYDNAMDFVNPMVYADAIGRTLSAKHFRDMVDEKGKIDWNKLPDAIVQTGLDAGMVTGLGNEVKGSYFPSKGSLKFADVGFENQHGAKWYNDKPYLWDITDEGKPIVGEYTSGKRMDNGDNPVYNNLKQSTKLSKEQIEQIKNAKMSPEDVQRLKDIKNNHNTFKGDLDEWENYKKTLPKFQKETSQLKPESQHLSDEAQGVSWDEDGPTFPDNYIRPTDADYIKIPAKGGIPNGTTYTTKSGKTYRFHNEYFPEGHPISPEAIGDQVQYAEQVARPGYQQLAFDFTPANNPSTNPLLFSGIALNDFNQPTPTQDSTNNGYVNIQTQQPQNSIMPPKPALKADTPKKLKKYLQQSPKLDTPSQQPSIDKKAMDNIIYRSGRAGNPESFHTITKEEYEALPKKQNGGSTGNWLEKYGDGGKQLKSPIPTSRDGAAASNHIHGSTSGREVQTNVNHELPPFIPYTEGQIWNMEHAQDVVRAAPQRKGKAAKALDIARNPMTALQSLSDRGSIPDNFDKGERNIYDNAMDFVNPMVYADAIGRTLSAKHFRDMTDEKGKIDWNKLPDAIVKTGLDAGMVTGLASEAKLTPQKYYIENANPYLMDASTMKGPDILDMGMEGTFRTPKRAWDIEIEDPEFTKASEKARQVSQNNAKAKERFVLDKNDYYKREITDQDIVIPAAGNYKNITNPTNPLSFSGIALNDLNQPIPVQDSTNNGYVNIQTQQPQNSIMPPKPALKADTPKKLKKYLQQSPKLDTPSQQPSIDKKAMDNIIYRSGRAGNPESFHTITKEEYEALPKKQNGGTTDNTRTQQPFIPQDRPQQFPVIRQAPDDMALAHNVGQQQANLNAYDDFNKNYIQPIQMVNDKIMDAESLIAAPELLANLGKGAIRKLAKAVKKSPTAFMESNVGNQAMPKVFTDMYPKEGRYYPKTVITDPSIQLYGEAAPLVPIPKVKAELPEKYREMEKMGKKRYSPFINGPAAALREETTPYINYVEDQAPLTKQEEVWKNVTGKASKKNYGGWLKNYK